MTALIALFLQDLYDARKALEAAKTEVETASRNLGIAERERDALLARLNDIRTSGESAREIADLQGRYDAAEQHAANLKAEAERCVGVSNSANADVWNLQDEYFQVYLIETLKAARS